MSPPLPAFLLLVSIAFTSASVAPLRPGFYAETCPEAEFIVKDVMRRNMIREPRSAASVMRFQFHDCFVNGCDASMLLDDTPNMLGEKLSLSNIDSLRDAVVLSGGPDWEVRLGREDSLTASQEDADNIMPSPRANASLLIDLFERFNLSVKDMVALSGSHSIGQARCFSIVFRLYNQSGSGKPDPTIEPKYKEKLNRLCPLGGDESVTGDLDATPTIFDNRYFKDLVAGRGFLNSDQTLYTFPETKKYVTLFSKDQRAFFNAFAEGMIKMGDLQSGRPGEIRSNCRIANSRPVDALLVS
ncbi:PEROXIDASE 72-RELATED [Salix koriyanagi]|uniref:Peroxidase n=1 Tax=Salix koriyanagi TaxID=2511006 RepID=A0A9Q0SMV4_9ROSI|nr:PEROXIDASE 72-RELATED [Salix koriyanagi]